MKVRAMRVYDTIREGYKGVWYHEKEVHDGV